MPLLLLAVASTLQSQAPLPPSVQTSTKSQATAAAAPRNPPIVVNARLVVLDVTVTDKAGKPIDGLTAKDFQVFEDGVEQRIRSFEPPSAHALPRTSVAAGASALFDPARPASFGLAPVDILVLDRLNTHFTDSSFALRCLRDYLNVQPALLSQPTALLSVGDSRFQPLHGFTRDRDSLLRALAASPTDYPWNLEVNGAAGHGPIERLDQSLRALEDIAQSYAAIPGRKNLIWVGSGFPSLDPNTIDGDDLQEVRDTLRHITGVLLDTRVALYAVDPTSSAPGMTEITDASQMAFVHAAGDALGGNADPLNAGEDFDKLGPLTGGRVIRGRNDVAQQIAASVDLGASFYTLSYTPSSTSDSAAEFRRIRVVCLRAGLTATTRTGYYSGQSQQRNSGAAAAYDLTTAAEGNMPLHGLQVTVQRDPSPNARAGAWIVHVGVADLSWTPNPDGSATASVYIMAAALDAKNNLLAHTLLGMKANAKPGADLRDPARTADFLFTAPAPPKAATLRFIVRDSATGRLGSTEIRSDK